MSIDQILGTSIPGSKDMLKVDSMYTFQEVRKGEHLGSDRGVNVWSRTTCLVISDNDFPHRAGDVSTQPGGGSKVDKSTRSAESRADLAARSTILLNLFFA